MLTEKDYCDYDTCVALKELGYKVPTSAYYMPNNTQLIFVSNPCRGGYVIDCFYSHNSFPKNVMTSNYIDAPTMWEAQKWLGEERGIYINVKIFPLKCQWEISFERENGNIVTSYGDFYDTANWYIMFNDCIKEAVKILSIC